MIATSSVTTTDNKTNRAPPHLSTTTLNNSSSSTKPTFTTTSAPFSNSGLAASSKRFLLRKSQSTPKLRSSSSSTSTTTPISFPLHKKNKHMQHLQHLHTSTSSSTPPLPLPVPPSATTSHSHFNFLKKISTEWSSFISKIKSVSDEIFNIDEYIDDLFIESDNELFSIKNMSNNSIEEKFLQDYQKYRNLDSIYLAHQRSKKTDKQYQKFTLEDNTKPSSSMLLQDLIRQNSDKYGKPHDYMDSSDDEFDETAVSTTSEMNFSDFDFNELRIEFEKNVPLSMKNNNANIGTILWEYRRNKWLSPNKSKSEIQSHLVQSSIDHIPKESYLKIYTHLIEKNKTLKEEKHINLADLTKIINSGWIAEEKWERAAKGLP